MLNRLVFLLVLLSTFGLHSAENLLRNADFSRKSAVGLPLGWQLRCKNPEAIIFKDETAILHQGQEEKDSVYLIYANLPLEKKQSYRVSYKVRSEQESVYQFYVEQIVKGKDKNKWISVNASPRKAGRDWQACSFEFDRLETDIAGYLAIVLKKAGTVEFKDISLEKCEAETLQEAGMPRGREVFSDKRFAASSFQLSGKTNLRRENGEYLLDVHNITGKRPGAFIKNVRLEAGKTYELSYRVIGRGKGNTMGFMVFAAKVIFPEGIERAAPWDDVWATSYQTKRFVFTVPESVTVGGADIAFQVLESNGSVVFKNISLRETEMPEKEKIQIVLDSPYYRNMIFSSRPVDKISGSIKASFTADKVEISFKTKDRTIASKILSCEKEKTNFSLPVAELAVGEYILHADFILQNRVIESSSINIEKLAPAPSEVVVDEGNKFYVNGEIFYPVSWLNDIERGPGLFEESMYYAGRHGMNTIISGGDERNILRVLDLADRFNMKVFLRSGISNRADADGLRMWQHQLLNCFTDKVRSHPALLGYFLYDEPMWAGIPFNRLYASYEALKEIDPYHPIWINAAPRGTLEGHMQYSRACDIYGVDIYPVPVPTNHSGLEDKTLTCVGKYAELMNRAVGYRKPIFMVLQGYAVADMDQRKTVGTGVYPSLTESRLMAYESVTRGAYISYWGTKFVLSKDFFDTLFGVTSEISRMSGLLTQGKITDAFSCDNKNVVCTAFEFGGKAYCIVQNASAESIKGIIKTPFAKPYCFEFFKRKKIKTDRGSIRISLSPYEVRIYSEAPLPPAAVVRTAEIEELESRGNPYRLALDRLTTQKYYDGKACWIWDEAGWNAERSKTLLMKEFELGEDFKKAIFRIAADDAGTVYINSKKLGEASGWSLLKEFDCSSLLQRGKNLIRITAADAGHLPCGVLAELEVVFASGKSIKIISDDSWRGLTVEKDVSQGENNYASMTPVKIVAPYGTGAWKSNVKLER